MESTKCFTSEGYISSKMSSVNQQYVPSSFEELVGKLSTSLKEFVREEHMLLFKREKEKNYTGCS